MLALALLVLAAQEARPAHAFTGLHKGERADPQGPIAFDAQDEECFAHLRLLDGESGAPLQGVRVDTWTEHLDPPGWAVIRLDTAVSAADGSVRVRFRQGVVLASKLVISKSGYESQQRSPEDGELFLLRAHPLVGRVLDLDLQPVAGATLRSRQGCLHAISASTAKTAADGSFTLEDFPLSEDEGAELEVFAEGHLARGELDPQVLRQQADEALVRGEHGCTILLARAVACVVQLCDTQGAPIAERQLRTNGCPVLLCRTDATGRCALPATPSGHSLDLETIDGGPPLAFSIPAPPRGNVACVRALGADPTACFGPERLTPVVVDLQVLARGSAWIPVSIFTESGFVFTGADAVPRVPRGRATLVLGSMDGFYLREEEFEIGAQPLRLPAPMERHYGTLSVPAGEVGAHDLLLAQSGGEGWSPAPAENAGTSEWFLERPNSGACSIARVAPDGEVRLGRAAPRPAGSPIVPLRFSTLVASGLGATQPPVRITWRSESADGKLEPSSGTVWPAAMGSIDLEKLDSCELPLGREYYAEFKAQGAVPRHVFRTAGAESAGPTALVPRAQLVIDGDAELAASFDGPIERRDGRFVLAPAPGPLCVRIWHRDGTLSLLSLVLAPGEQRTLSAE
ncbi:MAG: hypothetical protein IPJ19_06210 [Planctomycetes bacterium]|nr:hypothetical protein [Planctomycetota bacterium]